MTTTKNTSPAAAQLSIAPTDPKRQYLGDAKVVHDFVGRFSSDVIRAYDG